MIGSPRPANRTLLTVSGIVVVAMLAISVYVWTQIPAGASVCTHWNAAGECDGHGSKFVGIVLMPIIAVALVGLFVLIPRLEPRAANLAKSSKAYNIVWAATLVFFLGIHVATLLEILGYDANIGRTVPMLVGLMFVLIGSSLGQVHSNYFVGIRTPWTLTSDLAWEKTHRLGGRLFVILGLLLAIAPWIVAGEVWVIVLLAGILAMVIGLVAYSYVVWRGDPEAHPQ